MAVQMYTTRFLRDEFTAVVQTWVRVRDNNGSVTDNHKVSETVVDSTLGTIIEGFGGLIEGARD